MEFQEAVKTVKEAKICEDEQELCFAAAVILFIGSDCNWDATNIYEATNFEYTLEDIEFILGNFKKYEVVVDGKIQMEYAEGNEVEMQVEFALLALLGSGEIVREIQPKEDMKLKFFNANTNKFDEPKKAKTIMKKNLNEILFDQLERLSNATDEDIDLEVKKSQSIIFVSEQILDVAKIKLQVIAAGAIGQFTEIGQPSDQPLIEGEKPTTTVVKQKESKEKFFDADNFEKDLPDMDEEDN